MVSLLVCLVALALAGPLFVLHYLIRLPEAPACPVCRKVTCKREAAARPSAADRFWAVAAATPVRRCTTCGWEGRMRWRWAVQKTREEDG